MERKVETKKDLYKRGFSGWWIPKEVVLLFDQKKLSILEMILLAEIHSLSNSEDGCFAGNEWFAKKFQTNSTKISLSISKLIKLGLVKQVSFDGRKRYLDVCIRIGFKE